MKKFEGVQLDILNSTQNLLVSASAGSGKTTIMIEKIANLILNENVKVENLLVVTFTVLAANEMKDRLIKKFQEQLDLAPNDEKQKYLDLINEIRTASIDTIDGFSSKTLKKYFYELNISPNFEIISDATRDYYLLRAMNKTINDYSKTDKINVVLDIFGGNSRNLNYFEKLILKLYEKIINIENYQEFLSNSINCYVKDANSEAIVNDYILSAVNNLKNAMANCKVENCQDKLAAIQSQICNITNNNNLEQNLKLLLSVILPNFTKKELEENAELLDIANAKQKLDKCIKNLKENGIDDKIFEKNEKIIEYFKYLIEILTNFMQNYADLKQKNNLIDFNDLNRLMLQLLNNDRVKTELQQKYRFIFVDEYQDVNPLQDSLIEKLLTPTTKLFTVGDVKQSIYGFRGSSPEWFIKKYNNYKQLKNGDVFDMNVNFRSNPIILKFINQIFSKLMNKTSADIDYANDAMFKPKRDDIIDDKVKILLVPNVKEDANVSGLYSVKNHVEIKKTDADYLEAMAVYKQIYDLHGKEFYDSNLKQKRKLKWSDFSILTRDEKDDANKILISIFKENKVPININNKIDIHNSEGIKLVLSVLKCVSNIADDVDYLAFFMAFAGLDINEVVELRGEGTFYNNLLNNSNEKVLAGFKILQDIKNKSYTTSNAELIRYILNEKQLKYYLLLKDNGEKELNIIEGFISGLGDVENQLNLNEFIELVTSNVSNLNSINQSDSEESVTIQTIHKSKGLEYPVVVLFNASKQLGFTHENDTVNFSSNLGIGVDYYDVANRTKSYSLTKYAIRLSNLSKGYKEELRLLYVALTRAQNKLIITGQYTDDMFKGELNKNCYLNMILSCYPELSVQNMHTNFCDILFEENLDNPITEKKQRKCDKVNLDFEYPNTEKFKISFKNTVTGLNSQHSQNKKFETKLWLNPLMQYSADEDMALLGTLYHSALEKLDLTSPYTQNTEFDIDYSKIEKAHKVLSALAKGAINIKHEAEFMMYLPYNEIVKGEVQDKVLIQGVVDLIIEFKNSITIVDYKFSHLDIKTLKTKYAEQLELYKLAVEKSFKKPVEHMYIYSIETGDLY